MYPQTLGQWWSYLSSMSSSVLQAAGVFACLWLWINRRNLRDALQRVVPRSLRFNLLVLLFDLVAVILPLSYLSAILQGFLRSHGLVLLNGQYFAHLHPIAVVVLAIFAGDFIAYWRHRLEHSRWLWPAHVMHHSDTDMNWVTVYRFHPVNRLTTVIIDYGSLVLLGFPPFAVALNGVFRSYYGMWVHANVPWTYGRLGKWLVSPAMHRWHHVREGAGVGSNFGSVFAVFDRAFGTFYLPGPCDQPLGVQDVDDNSFVKQLAYPLTALTAPGKRWLAKVVRRGSKRDPVADPLVPPTSRQAQQLP